MAIYIKGMKMPKNCEECFLVDSCTGKHWEITKDDMGYMGKYVKDNCPLTGVPEPHGRLIDADKLYAAVQSNESEGVFVRFLLRHSPTVIEGEVEE